MIDAIIFDFGGVLIEWDPHPIYAPELTREEAAAFFKRTDFFGSFNDAQDDGRSWAEARIEFAEKFPEDLPLFDRYLDNFYVSVIGPVSGMTEVVEALYAKDMPMYGLTNWSSETIAGAMDRVPMTRNCLREVVVSGYTGIIKPDPAIYEWAIDFFGVDPATTLFVDNNQSFVDGATAVGLQGELFIGAEALSARLRQLGVDH